MPGATYMKAVVFVACLGVVASAATVPSPESPRPSSMVRQRSSSSLIRKSVPIGADGSVQVQASEASSFLQGGGSLGLLGPGSPRLRRVQSIAIFAQVFNAEVWSELQQCVRNVISAREERTVSLYVALTRFNQTIQADAAQMQQEGGLAESNVSIVQNTGADIGEFLQQVQQHSASASKSDVLFKLHSKSDRDKGWRDLMLQSLCGSSRQVARILALFENEGVGVVGPKGLTLTSDKLPFDRNDMPPKNALEWQSKDFDTFFGVMGSPLKLIPEYEETWNRIYAGKKRPPKVWAICAGSWFWSRSRPLLSDEHLLAAIPEFLQAWGTGYSGHYEDCWTFNCRSLYAFERLLPTIARQSLSVVEAPGL